MPAVKKLKNFGGGQKKFLTFLSEASIIIKWQILYNFHYQSEESPC